MGFTRGYSMGEEAGWRDGYVYGVRRGAQIAAEIGFYQGFVHAWLCILEKDENSKQRKLIALKSLLESTRRFHRTNIHEEDSVKTLESIRNKFKQVKSLLNCGLSTFDDGDGVSFSTGAGPPPPSSAHPHPSSHVPPSSSTTTTTTTINHSADPHHQQPKIHTEMSF